MNCKTCGIEIKKGNRKKGQCHKCYTKDHYFGITFIGKSFTTYIGDVNKEEAQEFYVKEKERILQDCIKNPRKYLGDEK